MNAGTNMVATVATNLVTPTVNFGSADNNLVFNVNSNAVLALANPALNSTNMTLLIGNGNATNNVFTVNGGQVTNLSLFYVGFGATAVSNQLNVINGGRISFTTNANGFNQMQGSYNSLIVAGANVAGQRATIDLGFGSATTDRRIYVGNGTGQNGNLLRVDAGGVVTNAGIQSASGAGNGVVVTNGGRAYFTGGVGLGRNGGNTNYVIVGGFDAAGNNSLLYCSAGLDIGGSGNGGTPGAGTNNWVLVDRGGILTMASIRVGAGGSDYNSFSNRLIIANGGQVFTTNACSVGTLTNGVNNWVSVGGSFGTTNSSWNLNFQALTIGASITNYISTNNYVLLSTGGILTNVSSVILGGVNSSLTFNGGTLAAGTNATLIATNVTTVGATNYVQAGGAFIDSVNFTVTNLVPLTEDPSSTGGGLTKLGVGTLFLNGVNTYTGNTLVGAGMLQLDARQRAYCLAPAVLSLAHAMRSGSGVLAIAAPKMRALAEKHGINVGLAAPDLGEMVYLESIRYKRRIAFRNVVSGQRIPMELTSLGRAYLATLSPDRRKGLFALFRQRRPRQWNMLEQQIERAIQDVEHFGYCAASWQPSVVAVSTPLQVDLGSYALNVSLSTDLNVDQVLRRLAQPLLQLRHEIVAEIENSS